MEYDLSNFYKDLKLKFNKSNGKEILLFLMGEFSKTISLKDERAIIAGSAPCRAAHTEKSKSCQSWTAGIS